MHLPQKFLDTIKKVHGESGSLWLASLPQSIENLSRKWSLSNITPYTNLSYHYVAHAHSKHYGKNVVLKIGFCQKSTMHEKRALEYFGGRGCVGLLAYAPEENCLLLEALTPGTTLKTLFPMHDSQAISLVIKVLETLHADNKQVPLETYPRIEQWIATLYTADQPEIEYKLLKRARYLADELLTSQKEVYLLHGDLHQENILLQNDSGDGAWVAIDPKGIVGELAYEIGACIRGPVHQLLHEPNIHEILAIRFELFSSHFQIEKQKLIQWSYVQAVLAAVWSIEDRLDNWKEFLQFAQIIWTFLP